MVGRSMIGIDNCGDADRIDAGTLPEFKNGSRCARCGRNWLVRVHYCPGCPKIAGTHFPDCARAALPGVNVGGSRAILERHCGSGVGTTLSATCVCAVRLTSLVTIRYR